MPLPKDVPLIPPASISVLAGSSLTFSANNWNTYQYVKLAATADNNLLNGQGTIRLSAASR